MAVLIDATVVRLVLVPAVMELLGAANWWLPRPLARILPRVPQTAEPGGQGGVGSDASASGRAVPAAAAPGASGPRPSGPAGAASG